MARAGRIFLALVVAGAGAGGWYWYQQRLEAQAPVQQARPAGPPPVPVTTELVQRGKVIAVGIAVSVCGVRRVEPMGNLPFIRHSVAVAIG